MGHSRRFDCPPMTSGLPWRTDILRLRQHVSNMRQYRSSRLESIGRQGLFDRFRFRPDSPAVALDDAVDDRRSNAGSLELLGAMEALEGAERFLGLFHVESGAV